MGQAEVAAWLRTHPGYWTRRGLVARTGWSPQQTSIAMRKLVRAGFVVSLEVWDAHAHVFVLAVSHADHAGG